MAIHLAKSEKAQELFSDAEFGRKWTKLYESCPWATIFQDFQYLNIWNRNFRDVCETIFIYETDDKDEDLIGLFPLAQCRQTGKLFITGDYHAEYQTWLATTENGNEFAGKAFEILSKEFPDKRFQMMFLAPNTPLEWLEEKWAKQSSLEKVPRPVVNLQGENTSAISLRKKGNKSRIRQFKKQGELKFEEIESAEEFAQCFDEIEGYSHLRVSGIHNVQFKLDARRKQFHIDLMKETNVVYPTVLRVGDKTASTQVCFRNRDEMLLCITSMSPFFAKQSPSKIHLLMLGNKLSETDYKNFDLSPGNGYKERFANEIDQSHKLTVFFNRSDYLQNKTKRKLMSFGREALEKLSVKKTKVFRVADKFVHKIKRVRFRTVPHTILKNVRRKIYENKEARMYSIDISRIEMLENPNLMKVDSVLDLLEYKPFEAWQDTTSQFHQKALDRFAQGTHSYSYREDGELLHYGWMNEKQDISHVTEVGQSFKLPKNTTVIFDYYTHPKARGKGLYQKSILQGLHDAAKLSDTEQVFIGVMADNAASRHVIEKLAFKYEGSLFRETRFGFVRKWQNWCNDSQVEEKEFVFEESYST